MRRLRFDIESRPFLVLVELTRACDLACRHCRATAKPEPDPDDLTTEEIRGILDDLAALGPPRPIVVFTGGDPLQRSDLGQLVRYAASSGLAAAVSPAGTPKASPSRLVDLRVAGASTVSFSLDGADPASHDAFRGVDGSFAWTVAGCRAARAAGLRVQVNSTVSVDTVDQLPDMVRLVAELEANLWSVFFLVPTGRALALAQLSAAETEDVLGFLVEAAAVVPLKTTEAPAYRRVLLQRHGGLAAPALGPLYAELHRRLEGLAPLLSSNGRGKPAARGAEPRRNPLAVGDGRGVVFVSHCGEVSPSGFLPLAVGSVRDRPLTEMYANSALFHALRDPNRLTGRCGRCEFRDVCGGSRSQAYARFGDPLAEDPTCAYEPPVRERG
ncbi:MAG: TIGR04053 family radical SAM/SPASM domain-containing protein [Acidimicrobiales bacterium]